MTKESSGGAPCRVLTCRLTETFNFDNHRNDCSFCDQYFTQSIFSMCWFEKEVVSKIFLGIVSWHHQLYPLAESLIFPNNINIGIVGKIIEFGTNFKSNYNPKVPSSWDIAF